MAAKEVNELIYFISAVACCHKFNFIFVDLRSRMANNPSIFTSDEYRAWLRRAPSSSAICEQMRASRDILNQQRAHRFSCSAENIHDALKHVSENFLL